MNTSPGKIDQIYDSSEQTENSDLDRQNGTSMDVNEDIKSFEENNEYEQEENEEQQEENNADDYQYPQLLIKTPDE